MNIQLSPRGNTILAITVFPILCLLFIWVLAAFTDWNIDTLPPEMPEGYKFMQAEIADVRLEKLKVITDIQVRYKGTEVSKSIEGFAFKKTGDYVGIYYNPETQEIIDGIPSKKAVSAHLRTQPIWFSGFPLFMMLNVLVGGCYSLKCIRREDVLTGVVTDITAIPGAEEKLSPEALEVLSMLKRSNLRRGRLTIREALPRFIVTCTFTSPETGETITAKGVNNRMLNLQLGERVTVLYNRKNPEASIVDVDGIYSN